MASPLKRTILILISALLANHVFAESQSWSAESSPDCPVEVQGPALVSEGSSVTFHASPTSYQSYSWTVSSGEIISGQGTSSIMVSNMSSGSSCTATVEILDNGCRSVSSATVSVTAHAQPAKFDEYGNIRFNDEKARLDNFAIQLQSEPAAKGFIIAYGTCEAEGEKRANRAKDYLVNQRGIDAMRIWVVDAGCKPTLKVELWLVPSGAIPLTAAEAGEAVSPCHVCKQTRTRRRRRGHR